MSLVTNSPQRTSANGEETIILGAFDHLPVEQRLPPEIILHIFSYLPPEDLARASGVCRNWRVLANDDPLWKRFDLKKLFPSLQIIDRTVWERCVYLDAFRLSFDVKPFDNRKVIPRLKHHFAKVKVENNAGSTLFEQPKGLTFNKLVALALSPKQGNETRFRYIHHSIGKEFGENVTDKTCQFIMTNSVLEESRCLSFNVQKGCAENIGYEMPGFLEAASLIVLTHMSSSADSPIRLYSDNPSRYTRCYQKCDGCFPLVVGGSAPDGLIVQDSISSVDDPRIGVGALWKFD